MQAIFAIDIGATCGYAIGVPNGELTSGVVEISSESPLEAYRQIRNLLCDLWQDGEPAVLIKESRLEGGPAQIMRLTDAMHLAVEIQCAIFNIPIQEIPIGTNRKTALQLWDLYAAEEVS